MSSELTFGPQWLRDTFQEQQQNSGGHAAAGKMAFHSKDYHDNDREHGGAGGGRGFLSSKLSAMKLAEFRYGREELLALFDAAIGDKVDEEQDPPDGFLKQFSNLWVARPQIPLNLQGPMSADEQRIWQRGANSEASLRTYSKGDIGPLRGRGSSRGSERGSRGRGGFERHRSLNEDEERDMVGAGDRGSRGRGRGGWFDRSISHSGHSDGANGGISLRKGFSHASYDDWRRKDDDEEGGGWRHSGPSSKRWNTGPGGWRETHEGGSRRYGDRDFVNGGGPTNPRWREPPGDFSTRGRRGGGYFGKSQRGLHGRYDHDSLPEWANDENEVDKSGGTFDDSGKFQSKKREKHLDDWDNPNSVPEESNDRKRIKDPENRDRMKNKSGESEIVVEEEEIDPDDDRSPGKITANVKKSSSLWDKENRKVENNTSWADEMDQEQGSREQRKENFKPEPTASPQVVQEIKQEIKQEPSLSDYSLDEQIEHLDAGNLVSRLVDDDDEIDVSSDKQNSRHAENHLQSNNQPDASHSNQQQPMQHTDVKSDPNSISQEEQPKWIYLDPQGNTQGPFSSEDMLEWFSSGYFPRDLMLRRTSDPHFLPLHEMIRIFGRIPFEPGLQPILPVSPVVSQPSLPGMPSPNSREQQEHEHRILLEKVRVDLGLSIIDFQRVLSTQPHVIMQRVQQLRLMMQQQQLFQRHSEDHLQMFRQQEHQPQSEPPNLLHHQQHHHPFHGISEEKTNIRAISPERQMQGPNVPDLHHHHHHRSQQQIPQENQNQPTKVENKEPYDAIKSLLSQLQQEPRNVPEMDTSPRSQPINEAEPREVLPPHVSNQPYQQTHASGSGWDNERSKSPLDNKEHNSWGNMQEKPETEALKNPVEPAEDFNEYGEDFVQPKSAEKREKKSKKAEERKKQRDAKRLANEGAKKYIPGIMERPSNFEEEAEDEPKHPNVSKQQEESLVRLQEEQRKLIEKERELQLQKQQQPPAQAQIKLAPWAKQSAPNALSEKSVDDHAGNSRKELTLSEIQRMEEERERQARVERERQEAEMRALRRHEEEQSRKNARNWASAASSSVQSGTKSLAEIQEEEARAERQRQEKERQDRLMRQKDLSLAQASVWGSASASLNWASKVSANVPNSNQAAAAAVVAPKNVPPQKQIQEKVNANNAGGGFWDDQPPIQQKQQPQQQAPKKQSGGKNTKKQKQAKEEDKVAKIFNEVKSPKSEFEAWCTKTLLELKVGDLDIATFVAFLNDIESPFEVQDYIFSYIGETKSTKHFSKEYLERRSRHRNALKNKQRRHEDDLLTPAAAINPNDDDPIPPIGNSGSGGGKNSSGNSAGGKNRKKGKKDKGKGQDATHLLGFNVTAGSRVNAGELDVPQ